MKHLLAVALILFPATASAQELASCAPHDEMAAALLSKAKEHPVAIGITQNKALMEVYASPAGTWTIVITDMLTGQSCIKVFGINYQWRTIPKPEQGT